MENAIEETHSDEQSLQKEKEDEEETQSEDLETKERAREELLLENTIDALIDMVCLPDISKVTWNPHHRSVITTFLRNSDEKRICCNILRPTIDNKSQAQRININRNFPLGSVGPVWYFYKMNPQIMLYKNNLTENLIYGFIEPQNKKSLIHFFDKIFQNFVFPPKRDKEIKKKISVHHEGSSHSQKSAFTKTSISFEVHEHHNKLANIPLQIYLLGTELVHQVSLILNEPNLFFPSEVIKFCQEEFNFEKELNDINTMNRMEADSLKSLIKVIESSSVKRLTYILNMKASPFPFLLNKIIIKIKNFLAELADSCHHLLPLETPLERIYVHPLEVLLNNVYSAMAIIKVLWDNSPQYHSIYVMEDYFIRLSWEIVRACQFRLNLNEVFSPIESKTHQSQTSSTNQSAENEKNKDSPIDGVIRCCEKWRKCYLELYDHFRNMETSEELWLPNEELVFLPIELFLARCEDLKFIWRSKKQLTRYNSKGECILTIRAASSLEGAGGPEIDLLEEELSQVDHVLKDALEAAKNRSRYVFVLTSKDWLKYFDNFRIKVEEIEQRYQCVMISAVQTVENTSHGLEILNVFRPLAARKSLFQVFFIMLDHVMDLLENHFEKVETQYVFRSLRVGKKGFSFSEMATWATGMRKKLEQDIVMVRNQPWLPYYSRLDAMYLRWSRTSNMLKEVVGTTYKGWTQSLSLNYAAKLRQPIFKWKSETIQNLEANFDRALFTELEESKTWEILGYPIPDQLLPIHKDCEKLYELINLVTKSGNEFNVLMTNISSDETQIFEVHVQRMLKGFYPGLTNVSWVNRKSVISLCEKTTLLISSAEHVIDEYLQQNMVILAEIEELNKLVLYKKKSNKTYKNFEFQEDIVRQQETVVTSVQNIFYKIENILSTLKEKLLSEEFPKCQAAFLKYVEKVDKIFLESLKDGIKRSFICFEGLLIGCRSCPSEHLVPVFELSVDLYKNKIKCTPSIDLLQETLANLKSSFELSFSTLPCLLRQFSPEDASLHNHELAFQDERNVIMQAKLNEEFLTQTHKLKESLDSWAKYRDLWEVDIDVFFENYSSIEPDESSFLLDIASMQFKINELNDMPDLNNCGIFRVNYQPLIEIIKSRCHLWIDNFLKHLYILANSKIEQLKIFVCKTDELLSKTCNSLQEILISVKDYTDTIHLLNDSNSEYLKALQIYDVLNQHNYPIPFEEKREIEYLNIKFSTLKELLESTIHKLTEKQEVYRREYIMKHIELNLEMERVKFDYKQNLPTQSSKSCSESKKQLHYLQKSIENIQLGLKINVELELLNLPVLHYPELSTFSKNIDHLLKIWTIQEDWNTSWTSWAAINTWDVSCVALQEMLSDFETKIKSLVQINESSQSETDTFISNWEVEDELLRSIEYCKLLVPLIVNFQNARLKPHHWDNIKNLAATNFDENSDRFTIGFLQSLNITLHQKELNKIFANAADEIRILDSLRLVEQCSNELKLTMQHIPNIDVYLVQSASNSREVINDLSIRLNVISSSKYAQYYLDDIVTNSQALKKMGIFLELLEDFQKDWTKWQLFFTTAGVSQFLITHASIFYFINHRWRKIASMIDANSHLRSFASKEEAFYNMKETASALKSLGALTESYIIEHYIHYPRFCFLCVDDVVEVISKVYDGESARPYLPKMFLNIDKLKQQNNAKINGMEIIGLYSKEGEFLELNPYVTIEGDITAWLTRFEQSIQQTLREDLKQCRSVIKTAGIKLDEVVKVFPLQVCVMAFLIQWSTDIQRFLTKNKLNDEVARKLNKKIVDICSRLSSVLHENMSKLQREKLKSFLLPVLQIKDQVEWILNDTTETFPNFIHFSWEKDSNDIIINVKPYQHTYGWEYQGLGSPSIINHELLKSFHLISHFLVRSYALSIIGPKSAGKSETVKALARLCGRNCKSITVTDNISISALTVLLLGTFQTNSWLIFENAFDLPLSYLPTLSSLIEKFKGTSVSNTQKNFTTLQSNMIYVDGLNLVKNPMAGIFFEFESSQENVAKFMDGLNDNNQPVFIKTLDGKIMAETWFTLMGIEEPEKYAQKLNSFLKLTSISFPKNERHIFGVHCIPRIVNIFEKLLNQPDSFETLDTLPTSIKLYLLPQIKSEHKIIFEDVFENVFSDFEFVPPWKPELRKAIVAELKNLNSYIDNSLVTELLHLYDCIQKYRLILLTGCPKSGKSYAIDVLSKAVNRMSCGDPSLFKSVDCETLCPQGLTNECLYGTKFNFKSEREQGFFVSLINNNQQETSTNGKWIILEGFYSYNWINEVTKKFKHDFKTYTSNCNQVFSVPNDLKIIINISSSLNFKLHPKEIFLYNYDETIIFWKIYLQEKMKKNLDESSYEVFSKLIDSQLHNFLDILQLTGVINSIMILKCDAFITILNYFDCKVNRDSVTEGNLSDFLTPLFIFAVIWSFGSDASSKVNDQLHDIVSRMTESLPANLSVYDLMLNIGSGKFISWDDFFKSQKIPYEPHTLNALKYAYLCNILMCNSSTPVLIRGVRGCGKSTCLNLLDKLNESVVPYNLHFDSSTTPYHINNFFRKFVMKGEVKNLQNKVICVENMQCFKDINHLYDSLAVLRYTTKHNQFYDRNQNTIVEIQSLQLCASFQTQTERLQRDDSIDDALSQTFHVLNMPPFDETSIKELIHSEYQFHLKGLEQDVNSMKLVISEALSYLFLQSKPDIYNAEMAIIHHPHLITNFIRGIALCNQEFLDRESFINVFIYECHRVFYDSCLLSFDRINELCNEVLQNYFCLNRSIVPADEINNAYTKLGNPDHVYSEITLSNLLVTFQAQNFSDRTIIFHSFLRHSTNMVRVLGIPNDFGLRSVNGGERKYIGGNLLLVGSEGSGKKTVVSFISKISGWKVIELEGIKNEFQLVKNNLNICKESRTPCIILIDLNCIKALENTSFVNLILEKRKSPKLRLVVCISEMKDARILYKYIPSFFQYFSVDVFRHWNESDLTDIILHYLSNIKDDINNQQMKSLCSLIIYIQNPFQQKIEGIKMPISSSKFLLMVELIVKYSTNSFQKLQEETNRIKINIRKFEETQNSVQELTIQMKNQHTQVTHIQQTCGNTVLKMRNIKSEQSRLDQELNKKSSLLIRQKEEAHRIRELINRDLNEPQTEMDVVHKELVRITKEEFDEIKMVIRPSPCVEGIFEIVMTILGLEASWSEAKKHLANSIDFISKIRKIPIENVPEPLTNYIHSILTSPPFSECNVSDIPSTAYSFLKWINCYLKYARIYKDYHPLKMQADSLESDMGETQSAIKSYQYDLASFSVQHKVLLGQMHERETMLEEAEDKMKALETKIQLAQMVVEQLSQDQIYWEESVQRFRSERQEVIGNSILLSAYVTYLGFYEPKQRTTFLEDWKEKMNGYNIKFSKSLDIVKHLVPLEMRVKWQSEKLKMDSISLENAALITNSPLTQILYDPLEILFQWFQTSPDYLELDIRRENYETRLVTYVEEGKKCFIKITSSPLPYVIKRLVIEASKSKPNASDTLFSIGSESFKVNPSFKLILIYACTVFQIPTALSPFANFVNIEIEKSVIEHTLTYRLFEKSKKGGIESIAKGQIELLDKVKQVFHLEVKIQELMIHFDEALSKESNLMESLQSACIKATELRQKCKLIEESLEKDFKDIKIYAITASQLADLFLIIRKLGEIEPSMILSYRKFVSLTIEDVFPRKVSVSWVSVLNDNNLLLATQNIYRFYQQRESGHLMTTIGLILSTWYETHLGLTSASAIKILYQFTNKTNDSQFQNPLGSWLSNQAWSNVITLSEHFPFNDLQNILDFNKNLWNEWCCGEQPENVPLPRHLEKRIKGVYKLALIKALRPDRFLEAAQTYNQKTLRIGNKNINITSALLSLASGGNFEEPIIIRSNLSLPVENILKKILPVCHPSLALDNKSLRIISIGEDQEDAIKAEMKQCAEKGYWILLKNQITSEKFINFIDSELQEYVKKGANRRFKVWVYNLVDYYKPINFFMNGNLIELTLPLFLRESIEHLYELVGENRISAYTTEIMKLHLIGSALMHIAIEVRQRFNFDVCQMAKKISEPHWEEMERILQGYVSSLYAESFSISSLVMPIYVSGSKYNGYYNVVSETVEHFVSSSTISDLSSHVSSMTHYTVPRSNELAEHLTQLEFVYKAPSSILTQVSQSLCNAQHIDLCTSIENLLYKVFENINMKEFDFKKWIETVSRTLQSLLDHSFDLNPVLHYYLEQEVKHLVSLFMSLLPPLIKFDGPSFIKVLSKLPIFASSMLLSSKIDKLQIVVKLNLVTDKATYFLSIFTQNHLTTKLDLGKFNDPLCIWSWLVRKVWLETNYDEVVTISLTQNVGNKDPTLSEGSAEVVLENLLLVGAEWNNQTQALKKEGTTHLAPLLWKIHLMVTPITDSIRKNIKNSSAYRVPVCLNLNEPEPLFWIYAPMDISLTTKECSFRAVRFLLS